MIEAASFWMTRNLSTYDTLEREVRADLAYRFFAESD